jgi:MFS family permease
VWCDQFGPKNKKTMMISLIQLGVPLGVVAGYFLTAWVKTDHGWGLSFIIQGIMIAVFVLMILMVPNVYFSRSLSLKPKDKSRQNEYFGDNQSVFQDSRQNIAALETGMNVSFGKKQSRCKNMQLFLKQKVFLFCALGLANLFFIITVVQFWAPTYLKNVLKVENEDSVNLSFIIICVSSPTLGVAFGGFTSSWIGGYESKHSILLCLIYTILACAFSIPVPLVNTILVFTILLWFTLFFGGAIVPGLTGIIIASLPVEHRGSANSITSAICNLLGYLPAPFVYSMIFTATENINKRIAFMAIMYYSFAGLIFICIATYYRYKTYVRKTSLLSIVDRRYTRRESSLTNSMAQVFGAPTSLENANEVLLEEEYNSDTSTDNDKEKSSKNESNIKKNIYYSESETNHSFTKQITNTPHFNVISNHDFDHLKNIGGNNNSSVIHSSKKEESIFSPIHSNTNKTVTENSFDGLMTTQSMRDDQSLILLNAADVAQNNGESIFKSL